MCVLKNYTHITTEVLPLYISIDLPVKGPKPLMDSLTIFLNKVLYHYFDNGDDRHLPYETVYSKDVIHLVEHYRDTYKRFFLNDSTTEHEFESDCLSVSLCAKTDSYVTYEVDRLFFGEGDEVSKEWVTFILPDGQRLKEIISKKNVLRFYEEHPELRSNDIWEHIQSHGEGIDFVGEIGLFRGHVHGCFRRGFGGQLTESLQLVLEGLDLLLERGEFGFEFPQDFCSIILHK